MEFGEYTSNLHTRTYLRDIVNLISATGALLLYTEVAQCVILYEIFKVSQNWWLRIKKQQHTAPVAISSLIMCFEYGHGWGIFSTIHVKCKTWPIGTSLYKKYLKYILRY